MQGAHAPCKNKVHFSENNFFTFHGNKVRFLQKIFFTYLFVYTSLNFTNWAALRRLSSSSAA